jgi:arginine kinase
VFLNVDDPSKDPTFIVWVNEEDEFRFISMQNGGNLEAVYRRLYKA